MCFCFLKKIFEEFKKLATIGYWENKKQGTLKNPGNIRNEPLGFIIVSYKKRFLVLQQETKYALVSWDDLAN